MLKHVFIAALFVGILWVSSAAVDLTSRLTLNAGFSLPTGDFSAAGDNPSSGFAKFGFGAGAEYDLKIGESGFMWSSSFHYIANDYQSETFIRWPELSLQEAGTYSNYALLTGIKYQYSLGESISLFAVGQIGMNMSTGPFISGIIGDDSNQALVEMETEGSTTQGYAVGFGLITNATTTLTVRYLSLGSSSINGSVDYKLGDDRFSKTIEWIQPTSMFLVTVGYAIEFSD